MYVCEECVFLCVSVREKGGGESGEHFSECTSADVCARFMYHVFGVCVCVC